MVSICPSGEQIPRDEAEEFVQLLIGEAVSRLQGLPARYTRDAGERKRLEQFTGEIRAEVAGIARKLGGAFRSGGELADAAGEDDAGPLGAEALAIIVRLWQQTRRARIPAPWRTLGPACT